MVVNAWLISLRNLFEKYKLLFRNYNFSRTYNFQRIIFRYKFSVINEKSQAIFNYYHRYQLFHFQDILITF